MRPLLICIFYGITATMMNLSNKVMISLYEFRCTFLMLFAQYFLSVFVIEATRYYGIYKSLPRFHIDQAFETIHVSLAFIGNIVLGLIGMAYTNLPMYVALRKLVTAMIYSIDIFVLRKPVDLWSTLGVIFITAGALIAGCNDLTLSFIGLFFVLLSDVMCALQLQLMNKLKQKNDKLDALSQFYYTAVLSLPIVMVGVYTQEEYVDVALNPLTKTWNFVFWLSASSFVGLLCNFSITLCTTYNSPMATTITGNVKDLCSMFVGLVAFGDVVLSPLFLIGLLCSTTGAMIYSLGKLKSYKDSSV
ncbi:unnamed protein product [Blepharisma stoltei]|uniref:Sugar phosphate transporter domain-containing protein n=1 Tax=Blepharisma stoltei TaxID=1481888 RepID=A0AAU9I4Q1_9CILI|nr:unnamed protein product [Blepharisma stoltei]